MLGLLGLIILHAKKLSDHVKENISLSIIIKDGINDNRIMEFQKLLDISEYVKTSEFITREEAAETMKEELGEDFIGFLGYNPLLPSIELHLHASYANIDSIQKIEDQLLQNPIVNEIFYQKSLVQTVNDNLKKISFIILGFSGLLLIIAIALINNTIRLSVYSKRFLIRSMLLVGATQGFVRRPFVIRGIMHGIIGALISIGMLTGILYLSQKKLPEIVILQDANMFISLFLAVIIIGIAFSWISTYFAVRKYLIIDNDKLYY